MSSEANFPPFGSEWRERKPYHHTVLRVVGYDTDTGKVVIERGTRRTKARADRFNGSAYTPNCPHARRWLEAKR